MFKSDNQAKTKLIVLAALLLLGAGALLFGIFGKESYYDLTKLTDDNIGQTITVEMDEPLPIDERNFLISFDEQTVELRAEVPDGLTIRYM